MQNFINDSEIPMGLGMALAKNLKSMAYFSSLSKKEQEQIINHTHEINSKKEMQSYVESLPNSNNFT